MTDAQRLADEAMCDSVRGVLQIIRNTPGASFADVREHCELRGDAVEVWPQWIKDAEGYVTEEAAARMIYEIMALAHNAAKRLERLEKENEHLRASVANNGGPCIYCNLPKNEWAKCRDGFPGCGRADDAMLCPNVGAALEAEEQLAALRGEGE